MASKMDEETTRGRKRPCLQLIEDVWTAAIEPLEGRASILESPERGPEYHHSPSKQKKCHSDNGQDTV